MAAKVVMVAVPTVVGLASIRVYSVTEPPVDGLPPRELPIYTPLPQSPQYRFVEAKPGVLESGLTNVREGLLPLVHSAQGFCVSVKNGSIQAYQTGEDVYHYLRDPPPGFLPRLGTITTTGMLGMILARKGSRFMRLAVPLGMMSAGASVCYPAQTVAVLKVSGRKAYAAGQWSTASLTSLFASKPKLAVADDAVVASVAQPQSDTGPTLGAPAAEDSALGNSSPSSDGSAPAPPPTSESAPTPDTTSAEPVPEPPSPVVEETPEATAPPAEAPQESTADAGAESVPVESSPVSEEPIVPEQPAVLEEPIVPEQPAVLEEPAVPDEPAVPEQPAVLEEPIVLEEPAVLQEPTVLEEPAVLQEPTVLEEPIVLEEPAVLQETTVLDEPIVLEEPAVLQEPTVLEEPIVLEEPAVLQEPAVLEEPIILEEPAVLQEPAVLEEPIVLEELLVPEEPAVSETVNDIAETSGGSVPDAESTPSPETSVAPTEQTPAVHTTAGGSGFQANPALMDFGQSSPEDADLYSTRT